MENKELRDKLSKALSLMGLKDKIIKRTICETLRDIKRNKDDPEKVVLLADEAIDYAKKMSAKLIENREQRKKLLELLLEVKPHYIQDTIRARDFLDALACLGEEKKIVDNNVCKKCYKQMNENNKNTKYSKRKNNI